MSDELMWRQQWWCGVNAEQSIADGTDILSGVAGMDSDVIQCKSCKQTMSLSQELRNHGYYYFHKSQKWDYVPTTVKEQQ